MAKFAMISGHGFAADCIIIKAMQRYSAGLPTQAGQLANHQLIPKASISTGR